MNKILTEDVEQLFQELLINCQQNLPLNVILLKLHDICQKLVTDNNIYSSLFTLNLSNAILENYLKLLDNDQFFRAITHDDSKENSSFLRKFFRIIYRYYGLEITQQTPSSFKRQTYFFLLDQIHTSTRIVSYLQNNLSNNENFNRLGNTVCASIIDAILYVPTRLHIILTNKDLEKYQNTLFVPLLMFIDRYFLKKASCRVDEDQRGILINRMLRFMSEITNQSLTVSIFLDINYPQTCLRWLSFAYLEADEYTSIVNMLYNIAYHDEGTILLQKLQCGKILRQFQSQIFNTNIDFLSTKDVRSTTTHVLNVLLASVVDPEELYKEEVDHGTISQIFLATQNASEHRNYQYETYHIGMFLIALMKLCTNDRIIHYVVQQNRSSVFFSLTLSRLLLSIENKQMLDDNARLTVRAITTLINILWSLSFHQQYKDQLLKDISLLMKVEKFRDTDINNETFESYYIPYQMSSLKRSIDGIWQNLYPPVPIATNIFPILNKSTYSLMISYSRINIAFCRQLYHVLSTLPELIVTVDFINNKHLWRETAQVIEQSDLILFLISKDFFYSKSCRQEFIYGTDIRKKLFFPVFIDTDLKATDWLHQRIARLKYVRFGSTDFLDTCEELVTLIIENLPMKISSIKNSSSINRWTAEEVKRWFTKNDILSELYDFYQFQNGKELSVYRQAIIGSPWKDEYERIKQRFGHKFQQEECLNEQEFEKFIRALECLNS